MQSYRHAAFSASGFPDFASSPGLAEFQEFNEENERLKGILADSKKRIEMLEARLVDALGHLKTEMARLEAATGKPGTGATGKPANGARRFRLITAKGTGWIGRDHAPLNLMRWLEAHQDIELI
ncbi:MAG: hypothetical protein ISS69_17100 [Phycisphaerae bacterium]|nr:hypothetical protein [Phycisphaerae bacterium]